MTKTTKLVLVAAAGLVAGVLLAPKSGEETRRDLKRKMMRARGYTDEKTAQAQEAIEEIGAGFKESATRTAREMIEMADSVRGSASKMLRETDLLSEEAKTRTSRAAKDNKHTVDHAKKTARKVLAP